MLHGYNMILINLSKGKIMLWNVKQAAEYLGVSNSMVYKMVSNNTLPCVRLGDCIRFHPQTIEELAKESLNDKDRVYSIAPDPNRDMNFNSQFFQNSF